MDTVIRISGVVVIGLAVSLLLKERYPAVAAGAVICAVLFVFSYTMNSGVKETVDTVARLTSDSEVSGHAVTLMKALGIAYITSVAQNICAAAGEGILGEAAVLAGKIQLILLCLPLVTSILELAGELA